MLLLFIWIFIRSNRPFWRDMSVRHHISLQGKSLEIMKPKPSLAKKMRISTSDSLMVPENLEKNASEDEKCINVSLLFRWWVFKSLATCIFIASRQHKSSWRLGVRTYNTDNELQIKSAEEKIGLSSFPKKIIPEDRNVNDSTTLPGKYEKSIDCEVMDSKQGVISRNLGCKFIVL